MLKNQKPGTNTDNLRVDVSPKIGRTHRAATPEDTLERVRPHLCHMGITRVGRLTGLDRLGVPVAQTIRPLALSLPLSLGTARCPVAAEKRRR